MQFVMCSWCEKKVRFDLNTDIWGDLEDPAVNRMYHRLLDKGYNISHSICPNCEDRVELRMKYHQKLNSVDGNMDEIAHLIWAAQEDGFRVWFLDTAEANEDIYLIRESSVDISKQYNEVLRTVFQTYQLPEYPSDTLLELPENWELHDLKVTRSSSCGHDEFELWFD